MIVLAACNKPKTEKSVQSYPYAIFLEQNSSLKDYLPSALSEIAGQDFSTEKLVFTELTGGMTSTKLYTFSIEGKTYVLRVMKSKHGIEPVRNEIAAHKIAANLGIAPPLLYAKPETFMMIMPFIEGHTLTSDDLKNKEIIISLGKALRKLHSYAGTFNQVRTQVDRARKHHDRAVQKEVALPTVYESLYQDYLQEAGSTQTQDRVLCHGDLNAKNILITKDNQVYFIDWASGTWDSRYTDLGYLTFTNGFTAEQSKDLLSVYFDREPTSLELQKLDCAERRTSFLTATVWFDFSEGPEDNKIPMADRIKELDTLLTSSDLKTGRDYIKEGSIVSPTSDKHREIKLTALGFLKTYMNWK
jgi:thiamine kinase-like enzyme